MPALSPPSSLRFSLLSPLSPPSQAIGTSRSIALLRKTARQPAIANRSEASAGWLTCPRPQSSPQGAHEPTGSLSWASSPDSKLSAPSPCGLQVYIFPDSALPPRYGAPIGPQKLRPRQPLGFYSATAFRCDEPRSRWSRTKPQHARVRRQSTGPGSHEPRKTPA